MAGLPGAEAITTERLVLAPLRVEDADEMVSVLSDVRLYELTGGHPASLEELRDRYRRLVAGPAATGEAWLNWIVRRLPEEAAVGTVQATIYLEATPTAYVAWVTGIEWQGRGFASEAATALVEWLRSRGIHRISASIHPLHRASARVAEHIGLEPTEEHHDDELVWRLPLPATP
ncbi:MAG: GNAT family N-acetyltransferase [Acidimicrobiales bacterium]